MIYPESVEPLNLCTSTMPAFSLDQCLRLAARAGYQGIELRVHDEYHVPLRHLSQRAEEIKNRIEAHNLELKVLNTYYGITETDVVDELIRICRRTGVRYFRVTLPVVGRAEVRRQAVEGAVVPSYEHRARPVDVLRSVKAELQSLARKTKAAGLCGLVEIHWGTVMSSFSSAYHLAGDLDPAAVAITLDPANMIVEGKEDWEFGIQLLRGHVANVHIKNASWIQKSGRWKWTWDGLEKGMVNWRQMFSLLADSRYQGMFAIEDFRVPDRFDHALVHLRDLREETQRIFRQVGATLAEMSLEHVTI